MEERATKKIIKDLNTQFLAESILAQQPRAAAEYAFAIALLYARLNQPEKFKKWARHCLQCLRAERAETLEDAACRHTELGGVLIPELFHEGTARQRFNAAAAQLGCEWLGLGNPAPFADQPATA